VLMILGVSTAWAEAKKERSREVLPTCCSDQDASSCCAKHVQNVAGNCSKPCNIEHWLQTACPLDICLKIVMDELGCNEAGISLEKPLILSMKGMSFGNLLGMLLHQAHLAYAVKDNVLQLTTETPAGDRVVSKIYAVGNLVSPAEPIILPMADGDV